MTADRLFDIASNVMFWPLMLAEKLPRGIPRLCGLVVAFPLCFLFLPIAGPLLIATLALGVWEYANDDE